jgi:hypothetical protein
MSIDNVGSLAPFVAASAIRNYCPPTPADQVGG